ncbi:dehydrogenase/reductase SDR family member 4 isoform X2 [Lingula anatina]|uniref:Dehydrogenase/reductase SDR family member 4 isoform X1 n=1 Tax=Lingula anatina TaxID=7574 RepID=A0A1S3K536_LINAN|nr:dehydrogenase/reductase SDR family member 4 isoform X1 [Lingula anatina]XP_013417741.1 dehydrogenase/reductase SDR family member 4 isoform X2 [Lingula anatina]|eukprot:XP_013417740.1 dehydrogenase/reductase SDR family member 4 isoform X1 [Lingula anatina]
MLCSALGRRLFRAGSVGVRMASTDVNPNKKLSGKVAIVTASTEGIGFSIAKRLAQDGAHVVISSRKQKNVDNALDLLKKDGFSVSGMVCHVGKKEDREKLISETVQRQGGVDILVNNAAVNPTFGTLLQTPEEAWDKIFDVNVKAAFLLCKAVVPIMEQRGGGHIVMVSSIGGYNPFELIAAYSVSKTALLGLTKALAKECAPMNIRVNGIAPGVIKTKFSEALWKNPMVAEKAMEPIPLKRFGEPDEMAGAVSFLVSQDSSYIVGETIVLTGGTPSRL